MILFGERIIGPVTKRSDGNQASTIQNSNIMLLICILLGATLSCKKSMLALLFRIDSLLKRFQEYPDKCRGTTTAMLAGT